MNWVAPGSAGPVHAIRPPGPTRQDFVGSQSPKQEGGMDLSVYGTAKEQLKTVAFTSRLSRGYQIGLSLPLPQRLDRRKRLEHSVLEAQPDTVRYKANTKGSGDRARESCRGQTT